MKPYQILLFLLSVFLILILIMLVFPDQGIPVTSTFNLKFAKPDDFLKNQQVKYADIQEIIENFEAFERFEEPADKLPADSLTTHDQPGIQSFTSKVPEYPIEVSPDNVKVLYPIFRELYYLKETRNLVRILHYGDSQIEMDRITSFIRDKMQTEFGGSGFGLILPVSIEYGIASIKQNNSTNWQRYMGFIKADSSLRHKRYGALFSFAKPDPNDKEKAWLSFSRSSMGYKNSKIFNKVSLYLTNREDNAYITIMHDDSLFKKEILLPGPSLSKLTWEFRKTPDKLSIFIEGRGKPELYGISFDSIKGVAVDNIPLRGSSGLIFSKTDTSFLHEMYKKMNVRMIILQFGGNIVPMNAPDYNFYESYFRRELNLIKLMLPDIPVIVIGPSDMSVKEGEMFVTYPGLIKVRNALKNATLGSGYAFWDMFEAMGGINSMPSWVNADPPLAAPDFVHFTSRGAKIIAEMFYSAFMYNYYQWVDYEKSGVRK